jgi:hypothetical protein
MLLVNVITWGTLLLGVVLSLLLGHRARSWSGALGIAIALGVVLFFIVNVGLGACAELKVCPHLGDTGLTYALSPLFAFPVFWLAADASRRS